MTLEQIAGAALVVLFLVDIFLTVLYARAGTGLIAPYWNRAIWALKGVIAGLFGRRRAKVLTFAGPLIVVSLIVFWALGLTIGSALLIRPELGDSIRPSSGDTPRDFVTALLVAGNSLSIVGSGDYSPHSPGTRLLYLLNSLIGASVLSLVLSYIVQIYSALRERNALALTIHLMTGGTGDAAQMLARVIPDGDSSNTSSELGNVSRALAAVKEAHHFYPLLFYFRFDEPFYSVSRSSLVLLDLVALIRTALDPQRYAAVIRSAPVDSLHHGALMLLQTLDRNFVTASGGKADWQAEGRSRQSYAAALTMLREGNIAARPDGVERYLEVRREWEPLVRRVAPFLGYGIDEIDRRGAAGGAQAGAGNAV
ncbi:ion channel [Allosphingosinicella deserti]|uniref:Potassium channel domain-containing protein n=1 Tax=Allosphingosinicella deserti TaxID=2116704 RepID=A0A2P7QZS1_9SPHN|nr:ion channel [Sphingomonas deserti]PSJ43449.1 hypothetical protein C7I55_03575 [Sphingomonas deserti]